MKSVVLSLGSNLGDRFANIQEMEHKLQSVLKPPFKFSSYMETEPVGVESIQPWYINRIFSGFFDGTPEELLSECLSFEMELGRTNKGSLSARTADIDILLFNNESIRSEHLIIPHPALTIRRFCLEGLYEIAADRMIPGFNKTVNELYNSMDLSVRSQHIRFLLDTESHGVG